MRTKAISRAPFLVSAVVLLMGVAGAAPPARAQSLADVAKKEEERRKNSPEPTKVYTNKDLKAVPAGSPAAPPAEAAPAPGGAGQAAGGDAKAAKGKDDKEPVKDQAYWAGKQKTLQDQLSQDEAYAEAMQTRINSLTTDFVNRDDPAQRAKIDKDRIKALADLDRLKKAIADDTKALATFQEDARRAGIPPGWLR
jgi:hypothetical protein